MGAKSHIYYPAFAWNDPAIEDPTHTDKALVKEAQSGSRAAFGQLYRRYSGMVHGILLARVPYDSVEDPLQEVFLRALPNLSALRDTARFGGWLAAIARNCAMDDHRRAHGTKAAAVEQPLEVIDPQSVERNSGAVAEEMLHALRQLPETYRDTLILRLVEGGA